MIFVICEFIFLVAALVLAGIKLAMPEIKTEPIIAVVALLGGAIEIARRLKTQRQSRAVIEIQRSEYVNFLVYNPTKTKFPKTTPSYSFINYESGLVVGSPVDYLSLGLRPNQNSKRTLPPHMPDGEAIIEFTIFAKGETVVISNMQLQILEVQDIPPRSKASLFLPILEPHQDSVTISADKKNYTMFKNQKFSLKSGDVDLFRVDVLISDEETPKVFKLQFCIEYKQLGNDHALHAKSSHFYISKSYSGCTSRIPLEKRKDSSISKDKLAASSSEQNFQDDNDKQNLTLSTAISTSELSLKDYFINNYWSAVFGNRVREDVQKYGVAAAPENKDYQLFEATRRLLSGDVGEVISGRVFDMGRGFSTIKEGGLEYYSGSNSTAYSLLLKKCKNIESISMEERTDILQFIFSQFQHKGMDAALIYDTLPILAALRTDEALVFLTKALRINTIIIQIRAAEEFQKIKYGPALEPLLSAVQSGIPGLVRSALPALGINGNTTTSKEIVALFRRGRIPSDLVETVADAIMQSTPEYADEIKAKTYKLPHLKQLSRCIISKKTSNDQ